MTWEEALSFTDVVKSVAKDWADRAKNSDLAPDLEQELFIHLVEKVSLAGAKDPIQYVKAACWKRAHYLILSPAVLRERKQTYSLDAMQDDEHVQFGSDMQVYRRKFKYLPIDNPRPDEYLEEQ